MSKFKKQIALALSLVIICSTFSFYSITKVKASSSYDTSKLISLMNKFPAGKYWNHVGSSKNNPDGYTSTPCTHHGKACSYEYPGACQCNWYNYAIQCMGFAHKMAYEITGVDVGSKWEKIYSLKASDLCVGDEIRYLNNTHSIIVLGYKDNQIAYAGANWGANCLIRWGTMNLNELSGFSYVYHLKTNTMKNDDFGFLDGVSNSEIWKTKNNDDNILRIRDKASLSDSTVIGKIPSETKFTVLSSKYWDGEHLWAKVKYDTITGYSAIEYAEYQSGGKDKVDAKNLTDVFINKSYKFSWNAVDGANIYYVNIYDKSKQNVVASYETSSTSQNITINKSDKYYIRVTATNTKATSWKIYSDYIEVSVLPESAKYLSSIILNKTMNLANGSSIVLEPDYEPQTASNDITWISSDNSVIVVSKEGKLTALKYGTATVKAYSKNNSKISASCKITVIPAKVDGIVQTGGNTSGTNVSISWNKVSGATAYRIYKYADNKYTKIKDVTTNKATISSLETSKSYKIMIRAIRTVEDKSLYSEYSNDYTVKTARSAPTGLECTKQTLTGYRLAWKSVSGASKYNIYRYSAADKTWTKISTVTTNYIDLKGSNGKAYKYAVSAVTNNGNAEIEGKKNSGVYCYRAGETTGTKANGKNEIWKTKSSNDASLNVRTKMSTTATVIAGIAPNTKFEVLSKKWDGKYLWAKVKTKDTTGYAVLNYATYQSNGKTTLKFKSTTGIFPKTDYTLSWNSITGANKYTVYIYDAKGNKLSSSSVTGTSKKIKLNATGVYYLRVIATNTVATSWKVDTGKIKVYALEKK